MHAKLRFSYGTMASGKSLQVLTTAHNFEQRNIHFLIFKSNIDTRDGADTIKSRIGNGIERQCISVSSDFNFYEYVKQYIADSTDTIKDLNTSKCNAFNNIEIAKQKPILHFIGQSVDLMKDGQTEHPSEFKNTKLNKGALIIDASDIEFIYDGKAWLSINRINLNDYIHTAYEDTSLKWILVDEAQFLTEDQVDQLSDIVDYLDIDVYCFGLRTDFKTHLFPGSKRLFEIADKLEEIKSTCECGRKNLVNARFTKDGKLAIAGAQTQVGGDDLYTAICRRCYKEKMKEQEKENLN